MRRAWPHMGDVSARAVLALERFQRLLEVDEKEERAEEAKKWAEVKEQFRLRQSVGFRMIKDKIQETWSGEQDVSNVAQLKSQADKWAGLWQEGDDEWDIRQAGLAVGGSLSRRL